METSEFEKLMREAPERADAEKIVIEPEAPITGEPAEAPAGAAGAGVDEPQRVTMSVAQFGMTVTAIYTSISDFVYKRVKKTDTAPAWTDNDREALNGALVPVLEQYNITVSPLTNLLITVAVIEAMRYNCPKPASSELEK